MKIKALLLAALLLVGLLAACTEPQVLVEIIDVQIYQRGSWPQHEPIPMNFTLPAGFIASQVFHGSVESMYTITNLGNDVRFTLRIRHTENPQWLVEFLAGGLNSIDLDGFAVYYERHYIHVYRHVTFTIVKDYIEHQLTGAEDEWDSLILISRAIVAGEVRRAGNDSAIVTGNYILIPGEIRFFGPDDPPVPLNFTLPDGFYQPWESFDHEFPAFTLRYRGDTYIQFQRSYLTPYTPEVRWPEWLALGWNHTQLNGHTIYYIEVRRCCHRTIYHNGIAFEKDYVFYEIFGKNVVNVDMEILLRLAEAIITS